ncbi:Glycerophosphoryl diester phosphodiesterase family-domain-containing protein [Xylariomycetidae sp. FL0641]|nr:Glycerophosphoryl diester phosphodiesterase family-domain-containing protein [Xylariomycetidae sp. FL0641]
MKFGRNLPQNQVPEWASSYVDYKGLKKLIKAAAQKEKAGEKADLEEFFAALDRNLEQVESFYKPKFDDARQRLEQLRERFGNNPEVLIDLDDQEELMAALLELRERLRKLAWFGDTNRRAFVKITKKLDKKVPSAKAQEHYLATKVDPTAFADHNKASSLIDEVSNWLLICTKRASDDARSDISAYSSRSLGRGAAKLMQNVPQEVLDALDSAIRRDDAEALRKHLSKDEQVVPELSSQEALLGLLQRSISANSKSCIKYILQQVESLEEPNDLNGRNCIHRLVIYIGRTHSSPANGDVEPSAVIFPMSSHYDHHYAPQAQQPSKLTSARLTARRSLSADMSHPALLGKNDELVQALCCLLDSLKPEQRSALSSKDSFGRIPLHYAAQYGFVVLCQIIMAKMQEWGQFNVENGFDAPEWQDKEGNAPLHLAVMGGHPLATKCLLRGENWQGDDSIHRKSVSQSSAVLAMAVRCNHAAIVGLLVEAGVDINWHDAVGETALHLAARFGRVECARILLEGSDEQKADIDATDNAFAWTPLHVASVDGHLPVVQLLVEAGADVSKPDSFGWTAKEHAALRGHLDIAELLEPHTTIPNDVPSRPEPDAPISTSPTENSSLEDRTSDGSTRIADSDKIPEHEHLKTKSLVMISLGSMDMRKDSPAVKLDRVPLAKAHTNQRDTALSLVVSAQGAEGELTKINLPVHDNISTEPILFTAIDESQVQLQFDIVPTYSGNEQQTIGRGAFVMENVWPTPEKDHMSLDNDKRVPIFDKSTFQVIGSVNFNVLVIKPFSHPKMEESTQQAYWRKIPSTMVFGHRGLGKNFINNKSLQLGENTISSFNAAANLGAHYVEFDVQLTKDHVPVIYHDFLVSEVGIDAKVHDMTLDQFLHIHPESAPKPRSRRNSPPLGEANGTGTKDIALRQRSMSVDLHKGFKSDLDERMKYTSTYQQTGYKANTRGNFVQAPFAVLEELFEELEEKVGFNIEMKYPMLYEAEELNMSKHWIEINHFCDVVLNKVYDMAGNRHIIFSSFNPDICLCLRFKQSNFPIMFLTDAGTSEVSDIRASSLQEAIRFASRWNLLGIVSAAKPLVNSPRLIKVVKQTGLVCASYGVQNNDPKLVQRQVKEGVDAVIVDNVLAIHRDMKTNGLAEEVTTNGNGNA